MSRSFGVASATVALALVLSACTTTVAGVPLASGRVIDSGKSAEVDPSFIKNTDGGDIDKLAGTVVKDVEKYWEEKFPEDVRRQAVGAVARRLLLGRHEQGQLARAAVHRPGLGRGGQRVLLLSADIIAWDRYSLLPVLKKQFGEASVMLVLAHEMGHAVQRRAGLTQQAERANPEKYPTILLEAQADCYAGSFVRWVSDGNAQRLQLDRDSLDPALEAMVLFRDPVGTAQNAEGAHGDAFDRVSAFQDGFEKGTQLCSEITVDNRTFTQRGFINEDDAASGGNLGLAEAMEGIKREADKYLQAELTKVGKQGPPPRSKRSPPRPGAPTATRARPRTAPSSVTSTCRSRASCPRCIPRSATGRPAPSSAAATASRCWPRWVSPSTGPMRSGRRCACPARTAGICWLVATTVSRCRPVTSTRPFRCCSATTSLLVTWKATRLRLGSSGSRRSA